ncbi:MAG: exodeoxyribonuclease VII small subunit [Firmicutes bacterium]|nr:exodeoxyribonuclease VII small subunit [Bacillota bacterium]
MSEQEKNLSFEEAMAGLNKAVQALNHEDTPLDQAIAQYEEGIRYYQRCSEILQDAKQKIQQFNKETGEVTEF